MGAGLSSLENDDERKRMTELYHQNKEVFLKVALKILRKKDRAEDALQNAFISIIKHKDEAFGMDSDKFLGWGITIVKNKCFDLIDSESKLETVEDLELHLEYPDSISVESQVIQRSQYEDIKKYLDELDLKSQLVMEMRYIHDMSYNEIAKETGFALKTIDSLLYRAKEKIRKRMMEKGDLI